MRLEKALNFPKQQFCMMEAHMKKLIVAAMLAVVAVASEHAPVASDRNTQTDGSFMIAQRYCPNGRC